MPEISDRLIRFEFGKEVRSHRKAMRMSQKELGERVRPDLDHPQRWCSNTEYGRHVIEESVARDICKTLGIAKSDLPPELRYLVPKPNTEPEAVEESAGAGADMGVPPPVEGGPEPEHGGVVEEGSSPPVECPTCEPTSHWYVEYRGYRGYWGIRDGTIFCQKCGQYRRIPS